MCYQDVARYVYAVYAILQILRISMRTGMAHLASICATLMTHCAEMYVYSPLCRGRLARINKVTQKVFGLFGKPKHTILRVFYMHTEDVYR